MSFLDRTKSGAKKVVKYTGVSWISGKVKSYRATKAATRAQRITVGATLSPNSVSDSIKQANDKIREDLERQQLEMEVAKAKKEIAAESAIFNGAKIRRGVKKFGLVIGLLILIMLPIGLFLYLGYTSHTGAFSYQEESYYGPVFSSVWSFIAPLGNLITSELSCVANPVSCLGTRTTTITQQVYPTFASFLSLSASNTQTVFLTTQSPSGTNLGQLFYSMENTGNVPIGVGTSNQVSVNVSCGSSNDAAAVTNCQQLTNMTSTTRYDSAYLFPGDTLVHETSINGHCPVSGSNIGTSGGTIASLSFNFTIYNYSAATIFPIEFEDNSFNQQLISSSQVLVPSLPSVNFVSPGPLQIALSLREPMPILTAATVIPVDTAITNNGAGGTSLNSFSIFVPMSLWPTSPESLNAGVWRCSPSNGGTRMNFAFPGSNYWNCSAVNPLSASQIILPAVSSLSGMHFNTVPILGYINYNYIQYLDMPFIIRPEGITCPS